MELMPTEDQSDAPPWAGLHQCHDCHRTVAVDVRDRDEVETIVLIRCNDDGVFVYHQHDEIVCPWCFGRVMLLIIERPLEEMFSECGSLEVDAVSRTRLGSPKEDE